jgi:hypothetical protein
MIAPSADRIGIGVVETMASLGFDYIELSLADVMDLPQEAFQQLALRLERSGIPCDTCNNFFPSHIRLTGEAADPAIAMEYGRAPLAWAPGSSCSAARAPRTCPRVLPMRRPGGSSSHC